MQQPERREVKLSLVLAEEHLLCFLPSVLSKATSPEVNFLDPVSVWLEQVHAVSILSPLSSAHCIRDTVLVTSPCFPAGICAL